MRILIDECLPRELAVELIGHEARTVQQEGWAGLKNGRLLKTISGRFEVFITIDKRIDRDHKIPDDLAVITIRARSNRIQDLLPFVPDMLKAVNETQPGRSTRVVLRFGEMERQGWQDFVFAIHDNEEIGPHNTGMNPPPLRGSLVALLLGTDYFETVRQHQKSWEQTL